MKLKKKKTIIASAMILGLSVSAANDFYVVKKGDTLSNILFTKKIFPVYGHGGSLAKTLKLNPNIRLSGGNKIFPKTKIILFNTKSSDKIIASDIRHQTSDIRHQTSDIRHQIIRKIFIPPTPRLT